MTARIEVRFPAPVAEVFGYLADPRNRPRWQSSLREVRMLDEGEPRQGMRWLDVTAVPGLRPQMEITEFTPYRVWAEVGTWRGISAELTLRFTALGSGTRVSAEFGLRGRSVWAVPAWVAQRIAPPALRADLERAASQVGSAATS